MAVLLKSCAEPHQNLKAQDRMGHKTHKTFIMAVRMVTGKCRFFWDFNLKPGLMSEIALLAKGISVSYFIGFKV